MIYKPRCEYATTKQKGGALHCEKVNGYCGFQYRCEQTGQWENTPTAKGCKARKPKEENNVISPKHVAQNGEITQSIEQAISYIEQESSGKELNIEKISMAIKHAVQTTPVEPVSERSKVTDEVEQRSEKQTAHRASGTKRGRRKKRDNVPSDAAQESTGGTADERLHPEGGTVSE